MFAQNGKAAWGCVSSNLHLRAVKLCALRTLFRKDACSDYDLVTGVQSRNYACWPRDAAKAKEIAR